MKALERELGLAKVIAISVGTMLGSGLFVLPGLAAGLTGPSTWLAYLVAGLCFLPATLSKAELGTAMPVSGGTYVYIDRTFGPLVGTIAGLGLWLSLLLKSTFALVGFGAYLSVISDVPLLPTSLGLLVAVVALNLAGVRKVGSVQLVVVVVVVVSVSIIAGLGTLSVDFTRLEHSFPDGSGGFLSAVGVVYISYAGVTKIAAIAEEVKNPDRNIPLGMLISLGAMTFFYSAVVFVLVGNVDAASLDGDFHPIYTLAESVGGRTVGIAAAVLGVVTMTSMANSGILGTSRFPFAMARDRLMPAILARVNRKFLTPTYSIVLTGLLMGAALVFLDVNKIAKIGSSLVIAALMLVNLTVIVLRETKSQWYQPKFRGPFYPYTQVIGLILGAILLVMLGWLGVVALLSMSVPGLLLYLLYGRRQVDRRGVVGRLGPRHDLLRPNKPRTMDLRSALPGQAGVVVPLFGHERSPESLVDVAVGLAGGRKVEVVHLTDVPAQLQLDDLSEEDAAVSSLRRRLTVMSEASKTDIEFDPVVTRDVVKTVYDISNRVHCDWVLIDWQAKAHAGIRPYNPLGWLVNHLPANLAFYKDAGIRNIREILVLAEPGPHDSLVTNTADHLAQIYGGRLTFVRFVPDGAQEARVQAESDYLEQLCQLCQSDPTSLIIRGTNEVDAVVARTGAFDLLVKGAPPERKIWSYFRSSASDRLTRHAACSVLRLKNPRVASHAPMARTDALPHVPAALDLADYLDPRAIGIKVDATRKETFFRHISQVFSQVVPSSGARNIEELMWERERAQNTAVGAGVAMPHATVPSAAQTHLGVFTVESPMNWGAHDGNPVDVFFTTVGPPSDRSTHLLLLAQLSKLIMGTDVLERLRAATSPGQVMEVLVNARPEEKAS